MRRHSLSPRGTLRALLATALIVPVVSSCGIADPRLEDPFGPLEDPGENMVAPPPQGPDSTVQPLEIPDGPCKDEDPAVRITCVDPIAAILTNPFDELFVITETGQVHTGGSFALQQYVGQVALQSGELITAAALSPTYWEDRLFFITVTRGDGSSALLRFALDDPPKLIRDLPAEATDFFFAPDGSIVLSTVTGDLFRYSPTTEGDGLIARVGGDHPALCTADGELFFTATTDPATQRTVVGRISAGLGADVEIATLWELDGAQRVTGCAVGASGLAVARERGGSEPHNYTEAPDGGTVELFSLDESGFLANDPQRLLDGRYGLIGTLGVDHSGMTWAGTINATAGGPTDDRAMILPQGGPGESGDPD